MGFTFVLFLNNCAGIYQQRPILAPDEKLAHQIDQQIAAPELETALIGIMVQSVQTGEILYQHNGNTLMMPASNMKLIVSATALKFLGPDYVYKTKVGLCGNTLVVIGSGDPLLGDERTDEKYGREPGWIFKDIIHALNYRGVESIEDIIVVNMVAQHKVYPPVCTVVVLSVRIPTGPTWTRLRPSNCIGVLSWIKVLS